MDTIRHAILAICFVYLFPAIVGAQVRTFGYTPLSDTLTAATAYKSCGLSTNQIAAMMLSVTWPETGARLNYSPSPMTMGRSDNSPSLYYNSTRYPKVFWYPGIGIWQLDEAGLGVNLSAAHRIATNVASVYAAKEMVTRYCSKTTGTTKDRRAYAWKRWYACNSGTCETIYNTIYNAGSDSLSSLSTDSSTDWYGGMLPRACTFNGTTPFICYYIDWNRAQGETNWRSFGFGPNPVSPPFYVWYDSSFEYRYWMRADTGYDSGILIGRSLGTDGRISLSKQLPFTGRDPLCDTSAGRGGCSP